MRQWFGNLPENWEAVKMRNIFTERSMKVSDKDYPALSVGYMGVVPQLETAAKTDNGDNRKLVYKGDFAINSRSDRKGAGGISSYDGSVSLIITVLKPNENINGIFYHYLLRSHYFSEEFYRHGRGLVADLWTTNWNNMRNILVPVPPLSEQNQIVKFLNYKVSRIDKLISIRQRQIIQLEDLKKAIISKAVTKGLNPYVPMKDSGVEWIGDIPAEWEVVKLRRLLRPITMKNRPELTLLSVVRELGVIVRDVENMEANHNFIPDDLSNYKVVQKGQFVINKMKAWQGSYGISNYEGIVSPAYFVFDMNFDNLEYFNQAIRSKVYVNFFAQASDGIRIGQWDLQMDKMKEIPFIIPTNGEQTQIAAYLDKKCSQLDRAISNTQKQIAELTDLKARLISDAVTGKIDVR